MEQLRITLARVAGIVAVLAAAALLVVIWANRVPRLHGGHDVRFLAYPAGLALVAGIGLLRLKKWSVVVFCVPLLAITVIEFGAVLRQPSGWAVVGALFSACIFLVPAIAVAWTWPALRPGA